MKDTIKGKVYTKIGREARGVPRVAVSNGLEVVQTANDGSYELPRPEEEAVVFIRKPAGYRLPLNAFHQPQFFRFLRPHGSPDAAQLKYDGFEPDEELPETINFQLFPEERKEQFRAVFFGDIQPKTPDDIRSFRQLMANHLLAEEMSFFVPLGDIAWDGLALYPEIREALGSIQKPYFPVCGNHDINLRAYQPRYSRETFQRFFAPSYYSFDQGNVHFVVLDDIGYSGWDREQGEKGDTVGWLDERQLQWLRNDLQSVPEEKLLVLLLHIPIYTDILPQDPYRNIQNRAALLDILQPRERILALAAHTHFIEHVDLRKGGWQGEGDFQHLVCGAACGAWWKGPRDWQGLPVRMGMDGAPNGYWVFDFEGSDYRYRFQPAGLPAHEQVGLRYPAEGPLAACTNGSHIIANVYAASLEATVSFQINELTPRIMERCVEHDPLVDFFMEQHQEDYPDWMKPRDCAHLWKAPMLEGLPAGTHTITIQVFEPNGQGLSYRRVFRFDPEQHRLQLSEAMGEAYR